MAAVERIPARAGSPRDTWESNFAEREWADDDEKWVLLRNALSLIEDLAEVESGRWGDQPEMVAAGRATCVLTDHVLFAFGGDYPGSGAELRDYALSRQAIATITESLDALLEGVR